MLRTISRGTYLLVRVERTHRFHMLLSSAFLAHAIFSSFDHVSALYD